MTISERTGGGFIKRKSRDVGIDPLLVFAEERIVSDHHVPYSEHRERSVQRLEVRVAQPALRMAGIKLPDHQPTLHERILAFVLDGFDLLEVRHVGEHHDDGFVDRFRAVHRRKHGESRRDLVEQADQHVVVKVVPAHEGHPE